MCPAYDITIVQGKIVGDNQNNMDNADNLFPMDQDNCFSKLRMSLKEEHTENENHSMNQFNIVEDVPIKQEPVHLEEQSGQYCSKISIDNVIVKTEMSECLDIQVNGEHTEMMNSTAIKKESIDIDDYEIHGEKINVFTGEEENVDKMDVKQECALPKEDTALSETNTVKEEESPMQTQNRIRNESSYSMDFIITRIKEEVADAFESDCSVNGEKEKSDSEKGDALDADFSVKRDEIKSDPEKEACENARIVHSNELPNDPVVRLEPFEKETDAYEDSLVDQPLDLPNSSETLRCEVCGKTFIQVSIFKSHILHHMEDFSHECKSCSERFKFLYELRSHELIHTEKKYKCNICQRSFKNHLYLKQHSAVHCKFNCTECNLTFAKSNEYREHMIHHRVKRYKCNECRKAFEFKLMLKSHLKTHKSNESQNDITSPNILKNPTISQTNTVHFECKICKNLFPSSKTLKIHFVKHKTVSSQIEECKLCSKKFPTLALLQKHIQFHVDECPYECKICSKKFTCSYSLKEHSNIHKNEEQKECKLCKTTFSDSTSLRLHVCVTSIMLLFKCEVCNEALENEEALIQHADCHISQPYECMICNKKCKSQTILQRHILIHTDDQYHECMICSKTYKHLESLKYHVICHTEL